MWISEDNFEEWDSLFTLHGFQGSTQGYLAGPILKNWNVIPAFRRQNKPGLHSKTVISKTNNNESNKTTTKIFNIINNICNP